MSKKNNGIRVGSKVLVSDNGDFSKAEDAILIRFDEAHNLATIKNMSGERQVPMGHLRKVLQEVPAQEGNILNG